MHRADFRHAHAYSGKLKVTVTVIGWSSSKMSLAFQVWDSKIGCISRMKWWIELIFCLVVVMQQFLVRPLIRLYVFHFDAGGPLQLYLLWHLFDGRFHNKLSGDNDPSSRVWKSRAIFCLSVIEKGMAQPRFIFVLSTEKRLLFCL